MKSEMLEDYEKLCFSCEIPYEKCGERSTKCEFNKATHHKVSMRYKQTFKQDFCGFPAIDAFSRADAGEIQRCR